MRQRYIAAVMTAAFVIFNFPAFSAGAESPCVKLLDFPLEGSAVNGDGVSPQMKVDNGIITIWTADGVYRRHIDDPSWKSDLKGKNVNGFITNGESSLCTVKTEDGVTKIYDLSASGAEELTVEEGAQDLVPGLQLIGGNPFYPNVIYGMSGNDKAVISIDFGKNWRFMHKTGLGSWPSTRFHPYIEGLHISTYYADFGNHEVVYTWGDGKRGSSWFQFKLIGDNKLEYLFSRADKVKQFAFCKAMPERVWFCGNGFVGYFNISETPHYEVYGEAFYGISYPCGKEESSAGVIVDPDNPDIVYFPSVSHVETGDERTSILSIYGTRDGCETWTKLLNYDLGQFSDDLCSVEEYDGVIYMLTQNHTLMACDMNTLAGIDTITEDSAEAQLKIYGDKGRVAVISSEPRSLNLYSIDGSLARILNVTPGENIFDNILPGIYIVNQQKIRVR